MYMMTDSLQLNIDDSNLQVYTIWFLKKLTMEIPRDHHINYSNGVTQEIAKSLKSGNAVFYSVDETTIKITDSFVRENSNFSDLVGANTEMKEKVIISSN